MNHQTLVFEKRGRIAWLTLNRAEAGNALNLLLANELEEACRKINEDDEIWVVVLTGAGEVFCQGNEPGELVRGLDELELLPPSSLASRSIASLSRPVIVALNGDALGGGLELALAGDIRLAAKGARLGFPEIPEGLIPGGGGTQRLPRIVGRGKALELILTGDLISAEEAHRLGLVSGIVPREELESEAERLAQKLASKGPIALRYAKEAINKGAELALEQGLRLEADLHIILQSTRDRAEGIRAFLEKREARFEGR
ncbi:MAG: hypothetical protein DRI26_03105 [Chloroflexi bacterium]|nr:MAG: hypothetical protein DRI26_03105 [Chloroflexota bacterium]